MSSDAGQVLGYTDARLASSESCLTEDMGPHVAAAPESLPMRASLDARSDFAAYLEV
jgi:hypothetical protein